jgi:hypothetical protein
VLGGQVDHMPDARQRQERDNDDDPGNRGAVDLGHVFRDYTASRRASALTAD